MPRNAPQIPYEKNMEIKFEIKGNQDDPEGNPIPKIKRTRRQYWTPEAQRYQAWKNYVQQAFIGSLTKEDLLKNFIQIEKEKPIVLNKKQKARMDIKIYWKNEAHADAENVFGSIADALFKSDKELDGSFQSKVSSNGKGRVEVKIKIY